jgi:hypothetical protein
MCRAFDNGERHVRPQAFQLLHAGLQGVETPDDAKRWDAHSNCGRSRDEPVTPPTDHYSDGEAVRVGIGEATGTQCVNRLV